MSLVLKYSQNHFNGFLLSRLLRPHNRKQWKLHVISHVPLHNTPHHRDMSQTLSKQFCSVGKQQFEKPFWFHEPAIFRSHTKMTWMLFSYTFYVKMTSWDEGRLFLGTAVNWYAADEWSPFFLGRITGKLLVGSRHMLQSCRKSAISAFERGIQRNCRTLDNEDTNARSSVILTKKSLIPDMPCPEIPANLTWFGKACPGGA